MLCQITIWKFQKAKCNVVLSRIAAAYSGIILSQYGYPQRFHAAPHFPQRMLRKHVELSQYHFPPSLQNGTFKITLACFFLNDVTLAVRGKVKRGKSKVVPVRTIQVCGRLEE